MGTERDLPTAMECTTLALLDYAPSQPALLLAEKWSMLSGNGFHDTTSTTIARSIPTLDIM